MSPRNGKDYFLYRIETYHLIFQLEHLNVNGMNITILSMQEKFYQSIGVAEIVMIKIYEYQ